MRQSILARPRTGSGLLDAVVLVAVAALAPALLSDADPLAMSGPFYWPVLAPLVVALRHGFFAGLGAYLVLLAIQFVLAAIGWAAWPDPVPVTMLAGFGLVVLVAGEFSEQTLRARVRAESREAAIEARLATFRQRYFVLDASHHQLERKIAAQSLTLNEAVQNLQAIFDANPEDPLPLCARDVLEVFVQFANVQTAAVFGVDENDALQPGALASVGDARALRLDDPLVEACLEFELTMAVKDLYVRSESVYLVGVPLFDSEGTLHGFIAIERIQFYGLNSQNVTLMTVLASNIADFLMQTEANPIVGRRHITRFVTAMRRAQSLEQRYDVPALLLGFHGDGSDSARAFLDHAEGTRRRLERALRASDDELLLLVEIASESELAGILGRLEQWCETRHERSMAQLGIEVHEQAAFPLSPEQLERIEARVRAAASA